MHIQPVNKTERLAKISRALGIVSSVFLVIAILIGVWIRFSDFDEFRKLALLGWVIFPFLGSLITGIPGCIIAIIALSRNKAEGGDPTVKKTAKLGLALSILGIVTAVAVFIVTLIFSSKNPPPPITTPIPSTMIP